MKLKDYAKVISKLAEKHPDANVICASDDEGNSFQEVQFHPTPGNFDGQDFDDTGKVNSVCIN